jgi:histidyl-tRNA synthetase
VRLKGTEDIFGPQALCFDRIETSARAVFKIFGFEELRTPYLESKKLFTHALGTGTDVVQKEMYEFLDKSGEVVALRPEGTAGIVRAYLENNFHKTQPFCRFFYLGPMFRRERPQKGRLRQFHQIGAEILGGESPYSDAEAIHCLTALLDHLGISGYTVKLNMLGTMDERQAFKKTLLDYFKPQAAALCEDCQSRLEKNVYRVFDCKKEFCRAIVSRAPFLVPDAPLLPRELSARSHEHFDLVRKALEKNGISYRIEPTMVRGLDYYTRTVFEITHPRLGAQDALGAGGRYDKLVESLGGPATGAVGFAIGVERLLLCLEAPEDADKSFVNFFTIATIGEAAFHEGFRLLSELRTAGLAVAMDFQGKSMKSQMRLADKMRSRYAIILGDTELTRKIFVLKNMETGTQEELPLTEAVSELKKRTL